MVKLVLLRHGQSVANQKNEYTGWTDAPLTTKGELQAQLAGDLLHETKIVFQQLHTSVLSRAIKTAEIVLERIEQNNIPVLKTWRLNERHYGALRGLNKDWTRQEYGAKQVALWRRSFITVPPLMEFPDQDRRYASYPQSILPRAESLKMASDRIIPYWIDQIAPQLLHGHNQLIVAHGSTLRALIKYIEEIDDKDIDGVEVANGVPLIYDLDNKLRIQQKQVLRKHEV
ncbi:2,3-bisphosphoglycerate-dependent phosphoglycerate mutase [Liquorilactobacillus satsumensis]|uniref:2,3-bisphosphoglycerate-dependent phosphoglycerate mutase n=1 Tax=Liquorilactobacillus satsumensis DSM 16230 = JCM 12392 TaxID=1423801 RepID=A0A0R1V9I5_9LACO|nr:2,3-diphosphoglycerate-dependent phosphoglycerate mutase [Liquorilactobacillus satsumensis]KRM00260.1 2,3-bisphosphoglycerate-dependent phosphoglycerate mutase [Liquorilactobacillus satsumensis DSM 16230 = JCM 12392]MCC7665821.1 phosphoglycerate mutase [Liquorilactobacillus satsumensis]MCP9313334.1 2,3-diphosphoglycerate-dependent phosphoglycerate mutase [Liquorilactobacillus satsumensis]MCP9328165.1 2,3-diphosphoglycerate-dependent phosphoglycerate mutase [Liquorilactobacillus satsumensis]